MRVLGGTAMSRRLSASVFLCELVHALMRQPEETSVVARAHLQLSGSHTTDGASRRAGCPPVFLVGFPAMSRVGANCPRRGTRQLHIVDDRRFARVVDEEVQRFPDAASSLIDGATLRVAAAYAVYGRCPPARLVRS